MLSIFDPLRDMSFLSIFVRLLLVVLCGGVIGIEREYKRRPAGFRTHILICLGAAMTTMTSQYLYLCMGYFTDMARLGAQVIAGIGFIGAGTIIVTRRQRVKGLTTAAGLWATAIIGLTLGAGYFEAGIFATILILMAELLFSKLEYGVLENAPEINVYYEYTEKSALDGAGVVQGPWCEGAEYGDHSYIVRAYPCQCRVHPALEQALPRRATAGRSRRTAQCGSG